MAGFAGHFPFAGHLLYNHNKKQRNGNGKRRVIAMECMKKRLRWGFGILVLVSMLLGHSVWAAPAVLPSQTPPTNAAIQNVRFHSSEDLFRIVMDMNAIPAYTVSAVDLPQQLEIELPDTVNRSGANQFSFHDPFVENLRFVDLGGGRFKAVISLKLPIMPKIGVMQSPTRLVVDLLKTYDSKNESIVAPGIVYTEIIKGRLAGPVRAHVLAVDLKSGYSLKPVLSNDSVAGVETLSEMADRLDNVAMINGPYFMRSGEILGLMKIDRNLVSAPEIPRTSFGILPDGKFVFDAPVYSGYIELPDKSKIPIDGVNRNRGDSELILYNPYYAYWTLTSPGGREYVIRNGRIVEVRDYNSVIPQGASVLSVSGRPAWLMAHLKVGDRLNIHQTIGPVWDNVVHAVGGGPCLVKNAQLYVTTLGEEFGSDVAGGRAPRTALGITKDNRVLLVVVDGRNRSSVGFTLLELAQFMLEQGAAEALNLDGGGSSEMLIGRRIVNEPSDGRERRMGAGIAVVRTKPGK